MVAIGIMVGGAEDHRRSVLWATFEDKSATDPDEGILGFCFFLLFLAGTSGREGSREEDR